MKRIQKGFTLIELMIVVAIVGILAAIALPAYQDFVIRSKMSEGLAAMAACKTSVQDYNSSHQGIPPASEIIAGCSTALTQYNKGLTVTASGVLPGSTATITVATQNTGSSLANVASDCTLIMTSATAATFEITSWVATSANCDVKYIPSSFR